MGSQTGKSERYQRVDDRQSEISSAIADLEAEAANEQVEQLVAVLDSMSMELRRLEARNRKLTRKLADLDRRVPDGGIKADSSTGGTSPRDQAVLDVLAERGPCKIEVSELKQLYRRHTDIKNSRTLDDRVKHLTRDGPFEFVSPALWEYVPDSS
ncbi:hypothetical protein CP557_21820 [Natrinema ejinorense]|uniref:Uncharacterized protein n=1 Tax=Natrinema ejinorense TaxID=373386 RepID=A0A2A5QPA6_9EURY|nr:hypothetical protein CP557_21820 [Natrinema ejinorense]